MPETPARAESSAGRGRVGRAAGRVAAAVALLAAVAWSVGPERLRGQLAHVDPGWFAAAVGFAGAAQCVSVFRWEQIARIFGLRVQWRALSLAYAQGMTLNVVLPGATVGGDALRSLRLHQLGNPLGVSALTVLLDRLSGLWVLCALSLLTALGMLAGAAAGLAAWPTGAGSWPGIEGDPALWAGGYIGALAAACALPWLPLRRAAPGAPGRDAAARVPLWRRLWDRGAELHELALSQRRPLLRSLWSSLCVQVLCALNLWACALAVGAHVPYWQVQAVAAPIFVAGALPLSYGGFGAREFAALVAFPLVGLPGDLGVAASALYGVAAIVLGLLVAPSFAFSRRAPGGVAT
jgi:glycosyltransferase 2 family protein